MVKNEFISYEQIRKELCTENRDVIRELFKIIQNLRDEEHDRAKSLDSKASSLFALVGVLVTANFLIIGDLSKKNEMISYILSTCWGKLVFVALLIVLVSACIFLLATILVREAQLAPSDDDLFCSISKHDDHGQKDVDGHKYRRFLCEHYWKLYRNHLDSNDKKATRLFYGQSLLFTALISMFAILICLIISFGPMGNQKKESERLPASSNSSPTANIKPADTKSHQSPVMTSPRPEPLGSSGDGKSIKNSVSGDKARPKK